MRKIGVIARFYAQKRIFAGMNVIIGEVQSICISLMGLLTLALVVFFPLHKGGHRLFNRARMFLVGGTSLVMIHFLIQYILFKNVHDIDTIRTMTNLVFGIPSSYLFCLSILYLQYKGEISKWEWFFVPILSIPAYIIAIGAYKHIFIEVENAVAFIGILYAIELTFNAIVLYRGHRHVIHQYKAEHEFSYLILNRWMKWSTFIIVLVSLGYPFVIFSSNLMIRSIYGVLCISSTFYFVLCFAGYGFALKSKRIQIKRSEDSCQKIKSERIQILSKFKQQEIEKAVARFEERKLYLQPELKMKEAAEQMQISVNMLRTWLHSTPYAKFSNWITHLRIEYAKELLRSNPMLSSEELAEQCGFCDRQYFQKQFIKCEGESPSKWIKKL